MKTDAKPKPSYRAIVAQVAYEAIAGAGQDLARMISTTLLQAEVTRDMLRDGQRMQMLITDSEYCLRKIGVFVDVAIWSNRATPIEWRRRLPRFGGGMGTQDLAIQIERDLDAAGIRMGVCVTRILETMVIDFYALGTVSVMEDP